MVAFDRFDELNQERAEIIGKLDELRQRSDSWTGEDREQWDKLEARFDGINDEVEAAKEDAKRVSNFEAVKEKMEAEAAARKSEVAQARYERGVANGSEQLTEEHRGLALQAILMRHHELPLSQRHEHALQLAGVDRIGEFFEFRHQPRSFPQGRGLWDCSRGHAQPQQRALAVSSEPEVIPEGFSNELERTLLATGGLRNVARIISTATGNDIPWPTWDDTGNSGALLAEAGSIGASVDPTIANITLKAYKYSSTPCLVSAELLQDSFFNLAVELANALGIRIARATNAHYTTGDDSSKPQGLTVGASAGVTAASASAITADELMEVQDSLDPEYERLGSVGWIMEKATRTDIRQLKSESNQYIWQPGLVAGEPDMLLGKPVVIDNDMPSIGSATVPIVYGAFEKYLIRDAGPSRFFRLDELYRANDQTGFVMFARHDGRLLNTGALKKLTMAV